MPIASALRSVLRWFGFVTLALTSPLTWGQGVSAAADGFDPNVNGTVYALAVQPDGKTLVAGSFTTLQPNGATSASAWNNIARVLPSGQVDTSFNGNVNGQISAMVVQADGKIVIGGKFTSVSGATRNRVARLNDDGTLDATFDPNVSGGLTPEVTSLALQPDQKIVVGGGFTTVQANGAATAVTRNRVARFNADGTLDPDFNPNANGLVLAVAVQADGKIVVGGGFTTLQPTGATAAVTRNRIARLNTDGSVDTAFNPDANNSVNAIAIQIDGRILIGGTFTTLGGAAANRLARLEASGAVSTGFVGGSDGQVYMIKPLEDGRIIVGGSFSTVGGVTRSYVARLFPSGVGDAGFLPRPNFTVYAVAEQSDGSLVLGGGFTTLGGTGTTAVVRNHVARVFANGEVDADFRPDANGRLRSVAVQTADGKVLVGGSFTSVGGVTHSGIVRLNANGAVDSSFNASVNGTVLSIAQQADGKIVIGGSFSRVNGVARFNLARLEANGTIDASFETATNNLVNAVAVQSDGKILLGGTFTVVRSTAAGTSVARNNVARINSNGSLDDAYKVRTNDAVQAIALQSDGKALFGGSFTVVSGDDTSSVQRGGIFRANVDGTIDTAFNVNVEGSVSAILIQTGGDIVFGGSFTRVSAGTLAARYSIGRVNSSGALDTVFDPSTNGAVLSLAQQNDGKILLGGFFTVLRPNGAPESGAVVRRYVARVNLDGTADTYDLKLDENPGNVVTSLVKNSSGEILIGGSFTSVGGIRRNRIARLNATGAVDQAFNADLNTAAGPVVESLTSDADGRVLAAGSFSSISGSQSVNLLRLNRDGIPDTMFTPTINGPVYTTAQLPTKGAPVATQRPGLAWLQNNGQLRAGTIATQPALNTVNKVLVDQNGKILLGGSNGTSGSLVRLNADGTADTAFAPAVTGIVYEIEMADDKILVAGEFTSVRGETRNNIARLNADGTLDTAFNPNANAVVFALERQSDGKIILGGQFTALQPNGGANVARNGAARINADGTLDTEFNPNVNQSVRAILLQSDGKIIIGGTFTTVQPNGATAAVSRPYLARLNANGTLDESFDLKVDSSVVALARDASDRILVGGYFSNIGGIARNYLARINSNGTIDAGFNPNPNDGVQTISIQSGGKILIGGAFSALDPGNTVSNPATATPRNRSARLNEDGSLDATFNPNFNNVVTSIAAGAGDTIIAGGTFNAIQPSGSLLVGGTFGMINGLVVNNLALFGLDGSISSTFQPNPNGAVYALLPQVNQQVIVAGAFTEIAGTARNRIARFKADDTLDAAFNPAPNGDVYALALQSDGKLLVGGAFSTIGGAGRPFLARLNLDGSNDASFSPSVSGAVRSIAVQADGKILVTYETTGGNQLVRLAATGSLDSSFNAANNGAVSAIAVQADGGVIVGGSFTSIGGGARKYLARLTANGTLDPTLTAVPSGAVTALTLQGDGKIVIGGTFYEVDGLPRFGIARIAAPVTAMDTFTSDAGRSSVTWTRSGGAPEIQGAIFEISNDGATWTLLGEATRVNGTSAWKVSGLNLSPSATFYVRARAIVPGTPGSSTGVVASQTQFNFSSVVAVPAIPVITSATAVNAASGTPFAYAIAASGIPTSYSATGLPAGLSLNTSTGLISGTPTQQGTFTVTLTAMNALGSGSATLNLFVGAPGSIIDNGRVVNLSVLAPVTATNPIIAGFVIKGAGTQSVLVRAVGPGLTTVGVNNGLATPRLKVFNSAGQVIHESNSWGGSSTLSAEFARLGAFPLTSTSADAAVVLTLTSGAYTLHVLDPGTAGGSALAEVYDALPTPPPTGSPHLINISARGVVATAGQQVTSGFVIVGSTPKQMLIRGIGPGLTGQGVTGALANPVVTLNKIGGGAGVIAQNDNWETPLTVDAAFPAATGAQISAAATTTGAFAIAAGSTDSAILLTLAPGVYTAQVGGSGSATGAAMVEIYEVP